MEIEEDHPQRRLGASVREAFDEQVARLRRRVKMESNVRRGQQPKFIAVAVLLGLRWLGAGGSWQLANRAGTMVDNEFNHGFAVDWMRKDLGIALSQAKDLGLTLPVTALVDQFYSDVQALGGGRWDTSSLIQRLRHMKGEAL